MKLGKREEMREDYVGDEGEEREGGRRCGKGRRDRGKERTKDSEKEWDKGERALANLHRVNSKNRNIHH